MKALCGHDIRDPDAKFCPACGKKVEYPADTIKEGKFMRVEVLPKLAFSPAEAAFAIGLSASMIYRLCDAGEIQYAKVGSRTLIRRDSLEAYLKRIEDRTLAAQLPNAEIYKMSKKEAI